MWALLARLAQAGLRSVIKKGVSIARKTSKVIRRPVAIIKQVGIRALRPDRTLARRVNHLKGQVRVVKKILTPKAKLIESIIEKSRVIENLVYDENSILQNRSNAERTSSELNKEITRNSKILETHSKNMLYDIEKAVNKELKALGVESAEDIERVINDEQFREDLVRVNSYETFMENWRNAFFAYDPEDLGMSSKEEMEEVWQQIEKDRDYEWFVRRKINLEKN